MKRPEVVSKRGGYKPLDGDVYVGRPSQWGNTFVIGKDGDRDEVIEMFRASLTPQLVADLARATPQRLVCWCAPKPCHADVLADALEAMP